MDEGGCFWCLVYYIGSHLWYYAGWYKRNSPVYTNNFSEALKLHSREEAEGLNYRMGKKGFTIEEHCYG